MKSGILQKSHRDKAYLRAVQLFDDGEFRLSDEVRNDLQKILERSYDLSSCEMNGLIEAWEKDACRAGASIMFGYQDTTMSKRKRREGLEKAQRLLSDLHTILTQPDRSIEFEYSLLRRISSQDEAFDIEHMLLKLDGKIQRQLGADSEAGRVSVVGDRQRFTYDVLSKLSKYTSVGESLDGPAAKILRILWEPVRVELNKINKKDRGTVFNFDDENVRTAIQDFRQGKKGSDFRS